MSLIGFRDHRKGSSFIETAILILVILMVSFGTVDFARVAEAIQYKMPYSLNDLGTKTATP